MMMGMEGREGRVGGREWLEVWWEVGQVDIVVGR